MCSDGYLPTVTEDAATTATTAATATSTTTAAASSGPDPSLSLDFSHIDKETVHRLVDLLLIVIINIPLVGRKEGEDRVEDRGEGGLTEI